MVVSQRTLLGGGDPAVAETGASFERVRLDDRSWVDVARGWLLGTDTLFDALVDTVPWRQGRRWMYERMVDDPRLSHWYRDGDELPHPVLVDAREALEAHYGVPLSGPGLNYYRDGRDSVAPHRDRELRDHEKDSLVAILTLGAQRSFLIRPRGGGGSRDFAPAAGDLIVMGGRCQRDWEHSVPKVARPGARISITWRWSGPDS